MVLYLQLVSELTGGLAVDMCEILKCWKKELFIN